MTSVQTCHRKPNCKDISNQDQTLGLFVQISVSTKDSPDHSCNWQAAKAPRAVGKVNRPRWTKSKSGPLGFSTVSRTTCEFLWSRA